MLEARTQYPQKLNVWAGVLNNTLIGQFFIDGNLNAVKYEDMLRHEILPAIRRIVGDTFAHTWFQQDGVGPHYGRDVQNFLDTNFPIDGLEEKERLCGHLILLIYHRLTTFCGVTLKAECI